MTNRKKHQEKIGNHQLESIHEKEEESYRIENPTPTSTPHLYHNKHKPIQKGIKKKFMTRIKEFSKQPINPLINSYDYESLGISKSDNQSSRQKNNTAARISRKRKRMYIELIEQQNMDLQLELHKVNEEIEMLRTDIFNALMHTDQINSKNGEIQSMVIKKLRNLTQVERSYQTDTEINICLDSCIYRIGASGSERRAILDILYKGFINRNLPNVYRFILWVSLKRKAIYSSEKPSGQWWEFIVSDIVKQSFVQFLQMKGSGIEEKGREILKYSRQILKVKKEIEESGQLIDRFIKDVRNILTPTQAAELFLFTERATPKKQLILFNQSEDEVKIVTPSSNRSLEKLQKKVLP